MISRRNIREKVLYTLYAIMSDNTAYNDKILDLQSYKKILRKKYDDTINNFLAALTIITRVARYAEIDANNKAAKYLPTDQDLNISTKIAGNKSLWHLMENESFVAEANRRNIDAMIPDEWVKKLFHKLAESKKYQEYAAEPHRDDLTERKMLGYIWKNIALKDENFQDILMDEWAGYEEDKSVIRALVDFYFKDGDTKNFADIITEDKVTYAEDLLVAVLTKDQHFKTIIDPKLKNWDADRVALIDRILISMGVAEFLYFPSIPKRVTINEYIEIAKDYSTDDSGRFVNGILDSISRDLSKT